VGRGRPGPHTGQELPAGRGARHAGPGRPFRGLMRHPVAAALLCGGLLAAGGGLGGLILLTGPAAHHGTSPLLAAHLGRPPAGVVAAPARPVTAARAGRPVYLSIPAIGVHTRLIRLGLTAQGALQVPASTSVAGWYTGGPRPGQVGSAVIAGHIDSYLGPGVFFRLRLLRPGDRLYVRQAGGTLAVFRVYAEHSYPKDRFPTEKVYGPAPDPELRLITCGGVFNPAAGSYLNNVVVYATQIR
jgi:sortase (surface protein transpeptidase)